MADIKTGIFAKNVQKRLNRAQEKVLQKLGKADETKDEQFEQVVINFRRQESEGSRLQREMKAYMSAIKGMQQASINLSQSLHEVYEPDWHGKDDVLTIGKDCDAMWESFHNKLVDSTLLNLDGYLLQFPDLKTRVAKRSRKLIDYDSARHHVETLQTAGIKNDRKMIKADEELRKAQRVFDELNVGLQDELPTLWDSRVGFYISTFKSVTGLETKFHREISLVCKQLYEVMMQLSEQHADKMFTIQGAPSDSGPLRLARTPSPPEDESPPDSPEPVASNHTLRPVSPGPPRPKSPMQMKKGPPVPPPPKVTPSKEVVEEQIIDLFGGEFLPAPSPSQPNERPGESLLDMDFDAFQPDESVSPAPQTAVPWDTWSAQPAQTAPEGGFVPDWSADFGSAATDGEAAAMEASEGEDGVDHQGNEDSLPPPEDGEAAEDEVSSPDGPSQTPPELHPGATAAAVPERGQADSWGDGTGEGDRRKSTPGLIFTNEFGEEIEDGSQHPRERHSGSPEGSGSEYETAEEWGDGGQAAGWASAEDELEDHGGGPLETEVVNSEIFITSEERRVDGEFQIQEKQEEFQLNSDPFAETQRGVAQDGGHFADFGEGCPDDSDSFAKTEVGRAPDPDCFPDVPDGGAFNSGAFDPDPFAGPQGSAFESDPFADIHAGAFDSDPFAETQEGSALASDPFADMRGGGAFDSDPFAETPGKGGLDPDPFAETRQAAPSGGESQLAATLDAKSPVVHGDGGGGWDPFGAASSDHADVSWKRAGESGAQGQDAKAPVVRKEPESSDMSEDETANLRFGKMYHDVAKEKEEDATDPSFFADFDQMNEVNAGSVEDSAMPNPEPDAVEEVPLASPVDEEVENCAASLEEKPFESVSVPEEKKESPVDETPFACALQETMAIPSVVIEPASSNEGDDDRDADIISPSAISDNGTVADKQPVKNPTSTPGGLPDDFMYKVETMHDFEAANGDELELKQGDVVLVVPTASAEDQEAGWLTGFKHSDWISLGSRAQKGLFPENFTQRLD
ncbi:amphiphysin [Stigmatopora argus]